MLAFAARAAPRRRPSRRSLTTVLATVVVLVVAGWVVLVSPLLAARDVQVVGTTRLDPAQVSALVDPDLGTPLARLDVGAVADRVEQLPLVADAEVLRSWPGSVEVRVTEREPVAAIAAPSGTTLVDASGRHLLDVPAAPADLPTLSPETVAAGEDSIDAAVSVLHDLPTDLLAQVAGTDARTPDSVTLTLRSGATVVWGSADDSPEKAAVLAVLLGSPAGTYDVSAPRTPVTR